MRRLVEGKDPLVEGEDTVEGENRRERIPFVHDRLFEAAKSYEQWLSTGSIALMKERLKIEGLPLEMPVRPFCRFRYL